MDTTIKSIASTICARHIVALLLSIFGIWAVLLWVDVLANWYRHFDQASYGEFGTLFATGQDYVMVIAAPLVAFTVLYAALRLARGK